ncbi:MAG: hypothetical protein JW991_04430 [Candidatus Pacebacteria bacterium]|nr:hypothetical protein [Candidatus Paceibacterota bacterium]
MSYSEIETPQIRFRILHRLEGKDVLPRDLPAQFDAVLIELVHCQPIADPEQRLKAYLAGLENSSDFDRLLARVKKNGAKLFFGDLAEHEIISSRQDLSLMLLELWVGLAFWGRMLFFLFPLKDEKRRRRIKKRFLKGAAFGFLGLWFLSGIFELLGFFLVSVAGNTSKKGFLKAVREAIAASANLHPEKTVVFLRNLVLAEKAWEIKKTIQDQKGIGRKKPLILLDFHFGHAGIIKMLAWSQEMRLALLRAYQPLMKKMLFDPVQRDYFSRLTSASWHQDHWRQERSYLVDSLEKISDSSLVRE